MSRGYGTRYDKLHACIRRRIKKGRNKKEAYYDCVRRIKNAR